MHKQYHYFTATKHARNPAYDGRCKHGTASIREFKPGDTFVKSIHSDNPTLETLAPIAEKYYYFLREERTKLEAELELIPCVPTPWQRYRCEIGDCADYLLRELLNGGHVSFDTIKEIYTHPE